MQELHRLQNTQRLQTTHNSKHVQTHVSVKPVFAKRHHATVCARRGPTSYTQFSTAIGPSIGW